MLSTRRLTFLGLALALSGTTVFLTQQWLQGQVKAATATVRAQGPAPSADRVLVAAKALPTGTILRAEDLRLQAWPAGASTAGYLTSPAATPEQLAGAVVRAGLEPGEPLTPARVAKPGERSFLAAVLKPGHRAVTLNVSASTGVAGFVFPGDRVDLILSRAVGNGRFVSETVLADIRVVGVDQRAANAKNEVVVPQTATLEVRPKQAEIVTLATELGKLSLSLRSLATPETGNAGQAGGRTWDQEIAPGAPARTTKPRAARAERPSAPAPGAAAVVIVRGGQASPAGIR